ncbi:olfactory receptor 2AP1-like [Hyperolius riggenbachi]|uniref:olfactory receptor 2AP1-like n=1 Tax=Hyperolius riggenbachi TaxID=752182 RepID=UPI0035A27C34
MNEKNKTAVTFFILKGFSDIPKLEAPISLLVLLIYLTTLVGNIVILLLICLDSHLHTPMYFFLGNLSVLDISYTTVTLHKSIDIFVTGHNEVSFIDCMAQLYFFTWFSSNDLMLLTCMGYDRYVAICKPLHFSTLMNSRVCAGLAIFCWAFSLLHILPTATLISQLSCYTSNIINHFFCDVLPLLEMSCSDTSIVEMVIFIDGGLLAMSAPFLLTFTSYVFIIATIMKIKSSTGRRKAFYTCSSHLTSVFILYASIISQYLTPSGTFKSSKLLSLFNSAVVPMLNPLIYSLKNKDVKSAVQKKIKNFMSII